MGCIFRTLGSALPLRISCIDNDLMDFCFSIPPALFNNRVLINLFLTQRSHNLAVIPLDLNSKRARSLHRGFKQELKYKLWCNYVEQIKFPFLKLTGYPSPVTTQSYVHSFSLKEQGIQEMLKDSINSTSFLEGVLNVDAAKNLLNKQLPAEDNHIGSGNPLRTLITATQIAKTFNS
jgi:hypothetical protein